MNPVTTLQGVYNFYHSPFLMKKLRCRVPQVRVSERQGQYLTPDSLKPSPRASPLPHLASPHQTETRAGGRSGSPGRRGSSSPLWLHGPASAPSLPEVPLCLKNAGVHPRGKSPSLNSQTNQLCDSQLVSTPLWDCFFLLQMSKLHQIHFTWDVSSLLGKAGGELL